MCVTVLHFSSLMAVNCSQIQLPALQDLLSSKGRAIAHRTVAEFGLLNPSALLSLLGKDHCLSLLLGLLQGWDLACLAVSSLPSHAVPLSCWARDLQESLTLSPCLSANVLRAGCHTWQRWGAGFSNSQQTLVLKAGFLKYISLAEVSLKTHFPYRKALGKKTLRERALTLPSLLGMLHWHHHPLSWYPPNPSNFKYLCCS